MPQPLMMAALQGRTAAAGWWRSTQEFFAYHGVWAFGVRAMRVWSLRAKMVLLVAVLALPLLPLMADAILDRTATVKTSARRIAGLATADAAYALARLLDQQRQAIEAGRCLPTPQHRPMPSCWPPGWRLSRTAWTWTR